MNAIEIPRKQPGRVIGIEKNVPEYIFLPDFSIHMFLLSPEITCQDEDSNQYFEGATWSVGKCIECSCVQGKIHCSRKLVFTSFLIFTQKIKKASENTFTEDCNQTECNVAIYMTRNNGVCHGK